LVKRKLRIAALTNGIQSAASMTRNVQGEKLLDVASVSAEETRKENMVQSKKKTYGPSRPPASGMLGKNMRGLRSTALAVPRNPLISPAPEDLGCTGSGKPDLNDALFSIKRLQ
jgi:hypothetical protein